MTATATVNDTEYTMLLDDLDTDMQAKLTIVVNPDVSADESFSDLEYVESDIFEVVSNRECAVIDTSFATTLDLASVGDIRHIHNIVWVSQSLGISFAMASAYASYCGSEYFNPADCVERFEGSYDSPTDWLLQRLDSIGTEANLDKGVTALIGCDTTFADLVDAEAMFNAYMLGDRVSFGGFAAGLYVWATR